MRGHYLKMQFAYGFDGSLDYSNAYRLFGGDITGEPEPNYIAIAAEYIASAPEDPNRGEMIREHDLSHKMGPGSLPWRRLPPECRE